MNLTNEAIDISVRKPLYRTELLQAQLIKCCCGEATAPVPVKVTASNPANGASFITDNSASKVVLTFSKSLQPNSVTSNSIVVSASGQPQAGTVTYVDTSRTATFVLATPRPFPSGNYTVTAKGAGSNAILDVDSLALDGNSDGAGGDDFTSSFTVTKPIA